MEITQRIAELLSQKGISAARMSKDLGFSNAVYYQWKAGKQSPSPEKIKKMAEYFNVPTDYLLGNTDIKKAPTSEELDERFLNDDDETKEIYLKLKTLPVEVLRTLKIQIDALAKEQEDQQAEKK